MDGFDFSSDNISPMMGTINPPEMPSASYTPPQINEAPAGFTATSGVASLPREDSRCMRAVPVNTPELSSTPLLAYEFNELTGAVTTLWLPAAPNQHQVGPSAAPTTLQYRPIPVPEPRLLPLSKNGIRRIRRLGGTDLEISFTMHHVSYPWATVQDWIQRRRRRLGRDYARDVQQHPAGSTPAEIEIRVWRLKQRLEADYLALDFMSTSVNLLQDGELMEICALAERQHQFWMELARAS